MGIWLKGQLAKTIEYDVKTKKKWWPIVDPENRKHKKGLRANLQILKGKSTHVLIKRGSEIVCDSLHKLQTYWTLTQKDHCFKTDAITNILTIYVSLEKRSLLSQLHLEAASCPQLTLGLTFDGWIIPRREMEMVGLLPAWRRRPAVKWTPYSANAWLWRVQGGYPSLYTCSCPDLWPKRKRKYENSTSTQKRATRCNNNDICQNVRYLNTSTA